MADTEIDDQAIFEIARKIEPHEARQAYLRQMCGDDSPREERIAALLGAYDDNASFLESPPCGVDVGPTIDRPTERLGDQIGPYKLLEQIGEGGFGVVYMAEQLEPVRRKVALKVIKPGMDTRQVIARFEAERQALAVMDHPNIARVFDAGTTAPSDGGYPGRPHFVMELVKGQPITQYCDENHLTPRQRLGLLLQVCHAIEHAHQKGIIHRDIKPSNILVALYDGVPVPKVIDFGVAKAIGPKLTEKTMFTGFGQLIGTLEYMSPEQAQLNQLDVDTRSDIYSLGVLLYELLVGTTPLDQSRLRTLPFDETLRIIREEEALAPSTRLSASTTLPAIAANRGVAPARLQLMIRGELDWIVLKCLEKDRSHRYETTSALAQDLSRYLADEPVQARPPSGGYLLRKFLWRNRTGLTIVAVVLSSLVLLGTGAGWLVRDRLARQTEHDRQVESALVEASRFRDRRNWAEARESVKRLKWLLSGGADQADSQRLAAIEADLAIVARLEEIRLRPVTAEAVTAGGIGLAEPARHASQDYADAFRKRGIDLETLEAAAAARRISKSAIREELIEALDEWIWIEHRFLQDFGSSRRSSSGGVTASRVDDLRAVLILADPDPLRSQLRNPAVLSDREALEALAAQPQVAEWRPSTALLLSRALSTIDSDDRAMEVLQAAQQRSPADLALNLDLSRQMRSAKRWQEAIGFAQAALAANPLHPGLHHHLGQMYVNAGRPDLALAAYHRAHALGCDTAALHFAMGNAFANQSKWAEAEAAYREAILRGPQAFVYRSALVSVLRKTGQWDKAAATLQEAVQLSPTSDQVLSDVAWILATSPEAQHGDFERAVELSQAATEIAPGRPKGWESLCAARYRVGDWSGAVAALDGGKRVRQSEPSGWYFLAMAYWQRGDKERALHWYNWLVQWEQDHREWIAGHPGLADELDRFGTEAEKLISPAQGRPLDLDDLSKRARRLAAQEQWAEARAEFARRFELAPHELETGYEYAAALLLAGDHAGYRDLCAQLAERGVSLTCLNQPGRRANLLARTFALAQQSTADAKQAAQWAQQALEMGPDFTWYQHTMGLAHFRAGRLDEAVQHLERSLNNNPEWSGQPMNWLALALVYHQRSDASQAREWLEKAARKIDHDRRVNPEAVTALGMHAHDWMTCLVLRREAESLIQVNPPTAAADE